MRSPRWWRAVTASRRSNCALGAKRRVPGTMSAKWTDYLSVGNAKVGMRVLQAASETLSTRYFHTDHLGSISVITEMRTASWWNASPTTPGASGALPMAPMIRPAASPARRRAALPARRSCRSGAFVHLNGRVYDPLLARFTSPDTMTESPFDPQDWNRYSYVGNDPLAFTDPSGHCFLGCFWNISPAR